ncbi:tRNA (guanine(37)-N(1))-methyltransferase [Neorickettsia helminthoeca str. Oregon]|uniref:tRNA (guanine-N(1)-)-methyltransferase n=2 Tax=Neorickettsia helminthoeca TaxID=33994 RepID=X5H5A7_9RICK|nr:tRNA (guanine(37)-N(1))-methyltransferase [Neorickettsia helminthoeca str. Oregon]
MFPEVFPGPLGVSVVGRGLSRGCWSLEVVPIRRFATKTRVDDTPYGGGPGMVMRPDVLGDALEYALSVREVNRRVFLSPRGPKFTHKSIAGFVDAESVLLVCGRFEGVDQRFLDYYNFEELSVGDYVLSGGEIAAMAVMDSCVRQIPGVLGNAKSLECESLTSSSLEHDHYTRPSAWRGLMVPEVLLSGDHRKIGEWRASSAGHITRRIRPDLVGE